MGPSATAVSPHRSAWPLLDQLPGVSGRSGAARRHAAFDLAVRLSVELAASAMLRYCAA